MAQSSPQFVAPATSKKANDAGHGNRFQSKLLMLYAMRAINLDYQFYLGTELDDVGGKFDDLIFKYKDKNDATSGSYHYAQAKHKLNENDPKQQINAIQLLCTGKDNNFDLKKYFQSYVKIQSRGDDIENCIICTNVHFDLFDLVQNDIIILGVKRSNWPKILDCTIYKSQQAFYKFKVNDKLRNHMSNDPLVCDFFDKLIFSVKTPNEDELDLILAKEVGKYFELSNNVLPSAYIMNEMVNWFKQTDKKHHWLSAEEAKGILNGKAGELMALNNTTAISVDYQNQLSKNLEFNDDSINQQLLQVLKPFWENQQVKILYINSKSPKLTAVKVISAVKKLPDFPNKDDYLVLSSRRIKEDEEQLEFTLKVKTCHHLLVVVDETKSLQVDQYCENLIHKGSGKKKIILISRQNTNKEGSIEDSITVEDLSETTKEFVGKRQVSFQGSHQTVGDLIDLRTTNEVFDSNLIENLLAADDKIIVIPTSTSSNFHDSLYIQREVAFPSADKLIKKLTRKRNCSMEELEGKCRVDSNGRIEWHVQDEKENEKIWKDIKIILKENDASNSSLLATLSEDKLIDPSNKKQVIIMGVAGTGKSTILSHYYKEIKKKYSDWWVIKIRLVDHTSELRKTDLNSSEIKFKKHTSALQNIDSKEDASDFLINATRINSMPFARSLLRHRLETGDRIVIMLDGFDEIDTVCQNKVIQLVKNLNESIPIYITTRPHVANQLQFELSQLAYSLVKFTKRNQRNFVTSIWKDYLKQEGVDYEEEKIRSFAKELIGKVSNNLKDREKYEFIGIPLQCRILAECFQSTLLTVKSLDDFCNLLKDQQFDLANLYKSLMEEKRKVFQEEKIQVNSGDNYIVNISIEYFIRKTGVHLRKLAIQTIVEDQNIVDILIPSTSSFESENDRKKEEKQLNESGIRFGLLVEQSDENRIQFLHRTYAEYLVADYIYNGFLLDEKCRNKLLENESIRDLIVEKLLVEDKYYGVRVFFDSMLKEIVENEEWRNRTKQPSSLSDRLQKFASLMCKEKWALHMAFKGRHANILLFVFDCLDVHLTPSEIRSVIERKIVHPFNQRTDVFQRILNYLNDADHEQFKEILKRLCRKHFCWTSALKQEHVKRNVVHFLDFMLDSPYREKLKFVLDEEYRIHRYDGIRHTALF